MRIPIREIRFLSSSSGSTRRIESSFLGDSSSAVLPFAIMLPDPRAARPAPSAAGRSSRPGCLPLIAAMRSQTSRTPGNPDSACGAASFQSYTSALLQLQEFAQVPLVFGSGSPPLTRVPDVVTFAVLALSPSRQAPVIGQAPSCPRALVPSRPSSLRACVRPSLRETLALLGSSGHFSTRHACTAKPPPPPHAFRETQEISVFISGKSR